MITNLIGELKNFDNRAIMEWGATPQRAGHCNAELLFSLIPTAIGKC